MTAVTSAPVGRVTSVDALRGLVMFLMIFVNDLAGAGKVVPDWMVHFSDRHPDGSGMTLVDLVFPAFLFLVGMSVPLALGARLARGGTPAGSLGHVVVRTAALLWIGILMVHETPDSDALGWPGAVWCVLMYLSVMAAFSSCALSSPAPGASPSTGGLIAAGRVIRWAGLAGSIGLALAFRGPENQRILTLSPPSIDTQWYGILGLIGWAYLEASIVFLVFRGHRTAILGCLGLAICLFAAEQAGLFDGWWLGRVVGIGGTLGSLPGIALGGLLLGSILTAPDLASLGARTRFVGLFVAGCAMAALLLTPVYGISKNQATPAWCLWACAITAALWLGFHLLADVRSPGFVSRVLAGWGQNVLLAYLISMMLPSLLDLLGWGSSYGQLASTLPAAIIRSALCALGVLAFSTHLNRMGLRLRL